MDTEPVPQQGATSAEEKVIEAEEKAKEDGNSGLDAPAPMYEERNERDEDGDNTDEETEEQEQEQEQEQQPEQQPRGANVWRPQPRNRRQAAHRTTFTAMQMQELEGIFHRCPYPNRLLR